MGTCAAFPGYSDEILSTLSQESSVVTGQQRGLGLASRSADFDGMSFRLETSILSSGRTRWKPASYCALGENSKLKFCDCGLRDSRTVEGPQTGAAAGGSDSQWIRAVFYFRPAFGIRYAGEERMVRYA